MGQARTPVLPHTSSVTLTLAHIPWLSGRSTLRAMSILFGTTYSWDSVSPELSLCGEVSHDQKIGPKFAERYVVTCDVFVAEGSTL